MRGHVLPSALTSEHLSVTLFSTLMALTSIGRRSLHLRQLLNACNTAADSSWTIWGKCAVWAFMNKMYQCIPCFGLICWITNNWKSDLRNFKSIKCWREACWRAETLWSCVEPDILFIIKRGPSDTILSMGCFRQTQLRNRVWAHELPILSASCPETYSRTRRGWSNMHGGCFKLGPMRVVILWVEQHEQPGVTTALVHLMATPLSFR